MYCLGILVYSVYRYYMKPMFENKTNLCIKREEVDFYSILKCDE